MIKHRVRFVRHNEVRIEVECGGLIADHIIPAQYASDKELIESVVQNIVRREGWDN